jgi:hypothetical protein
VLDEAHLVGEVVLPGCFAGSRIEDDAVGERVSDSWRSGVRWLLLFLSAHPLVVCGHC